jgi:UDP-N-acetyl-D-mannosaminuronic acid dehydrogenase
VSSFDVCIVGGAGHVGLPLGIAFAQAGLSVLLYDINEVALATIAKSEMPFMEEGGQEALNHAWERITTTSEPSNVSLAATVVIVIGTPVDEYLNPRVRDVLGCVDQLMPFLKSRQLIVLRSTVYPGTTRLVHQQLKAAGLGCKVAYCPERVVQGKALEEIRRLPQIVAGVGAPAQAEAAHLFMKIAPKIVYVTPEEAELAKLFTNAYRYLQFAAVNSFYQAARACEVDYYRVAQAMKEDYPRMESLPKSAGFAAGPCLFKDTMQLAAVSPFGLGFEAMRVNEGMPGYVLTRLEALLRLRERGLAETTVGLLGMAFKPDSDDTRSSLSYKLKKLLELRAERVLTTDPFVRSDGVLLPLERVIDESDVLVLCVPHSTYKDLALKKPVVDIWGFWR